MSSGLRWGRLEMIVPCCLIVDRFSDSFCWRISFISGLLRPIFPINLEPSWSILSFTVSRHALSCRILTLTYFGRCKTILSALFWIFCNSSNTVSGTCKKATHPYSNIDLIYTLYRRSRVFGSVPPHANILRIFSLFSAF